MMYGGSSLWTLACLLVHCFFSLTNIRLPSIHNTELCWLWQEKQKQITVEGFFWKTRHATISCYLVRVLKHGFRQNSKTKTSWKCNAHCHLGCLFILKLTVLKFNNYYDNKLQFLTDWVSVCKVGVLQYFLCNYTLAHLKTAVLTLFFFAFMCLCDCRNKRRSLLCTEEIEDMGSKRTIVMVS